MFDLHKNPRPYFTAPHVKFHIQNENDVEGVAMCGGIYPRERYMVFSASFALRFDEKNQCKCCIAELHRRASAQQLELKTLVLTSDLLEAVSV